MKFIILILFLATNAHAFDIYQPPSIFTNSPLKTFQLQKSWFYHSKLTNSYIYQAYLPAFTKDQIKIKVSTRLAGGYQIYVSASKWTTKQNKYLPSKELFTFSDTINLPPSSPHLLEQSFHDNILTVIIPYTHTTTPSP